jgi:hypothetical protein
LGFATNGFRDLVNERSRVDETSLLGVPTSLESPSSPTPVSSPGLGSYIESTDRHSPSRAKIRGRCSSVTSLPTLPLSTKSKRLDKGSKTHGHRYPESQTCASVASTAIHSPSRLRASMPARVLHGLNPLQTSPTRHVPLRSQSNCLPHRSIVLQ